LPHGEGFGLPLFEAAYSGMPVITVGWSGQCDFLYDLEGKERFYNVAFDLHPVQEEAVWDGVIQKDSMWAFAREHSAKQCMRKCYEDVGTKNLTACEYSKELKERFAKEKLYQQFVDSVLNTAGVISEQSKVIVL
jgi:glycosyltransferase involved in cell wall biosynthesis